MSLKGGHKGGLFLKFLVSFVLVTVIPFLVIEYLYLSGIRSCDRPVLSQSRHLVTKLAILAIQQKVTDVAKELEIYFRAHNENAIKLKNDTFVRSLAVQPVGEIGYTEVHTRDGIPLFTKTGDTSEGIHLQEKSQKYWAIFKKGSLKPTGGFYSWEGLDGRPVKWYMYSAPVKGTNLVVSATASMKKIFEPLNRVGAAIQSREKVMFYYLVGISAVFIIYLILISFLLARRIARPILHLAYVADRIGLGDFDVKISSKTRDEIMVLIEAVDRMKASLKTAVRYLRNKENR